MKLLQLVGAVLFILNFSTNLSAEIIYISSQQEFDDAHDNSTMGDSIIWRTGVYSDIFMDIEDDHIYVGVETLGKTVFNGESRVDIEGDYVTLEGMQFLDGDIGTKDVINTRGSYGLFTQINIRAYTSYKYLRVREESSYVVISYCNFENRLNLDDQNILSILVDDNNPGYHKIQYCSFKNFDGSGNDLGIEPIRIGLSTQADNISRSLVEFCYFTHCDGDGELISSKARQTVYRFNTFENNPKAELVLRHGSEAIVYGNFFLNGKGGVRVREGQDHYIYNNYFYELDDRAIYLQNDDSDRLGNINIAFNTIHDCSEIILGGDGPDFPTNVTLSNNIFSDPDDELFEDETGSEKWIGNIAFGDLGIPSPSSGINMIDPVLNENSEGYFGLSVNSPAIDAAMPGYADLPQFNGMDGIDSEVMFDLMGQSRPASIEEKDLGCSEYPHDVIIQAIATEENTGPTYNTSTFTAINDDILVVSDLIKIAPNPVGMHLNLAIKSLNNVDLMVALYNLEGQMIETLIDRPTFIGEAIESRKLQDIPLGAYTVRATSIDQEGVIRTQAVKFIKVL